MSAVGAAASDAVVARRALRVLAFLLLGKLVAAGKEMAIAWRYGVSEVVDGYLVAFAIGNWIPSVWMTVLTLVLVPLLARGGGFGVDTLRRFEAELAGATLALGALAAVRRRRLHRRERVGEPAEVAPAALGLDPCERLLGGLRPRVELVVVRDHGSPRAARTFMPNARRAGCDDVDSIGSVRVAP